MAATDFDRHSEPVVVLSTQPIALSKVLRNCNRKSEEICSAEGEDSVVICSEVREEEAKKEVRF
ncbi:hypothetical protein HanRHA438_Chr10g0476431 [Helianthus annuus]|nr:hypothetical protein HanRHA438_Chr10g0476361 [Helianthus annuus]KAJ0881643.1 hypothetical protein HanRHA438_Chr10g0476431 [Helianthus annuus]